MSTLPEKVNAGDETWVQLAPWGRYPNDGVDQILDEEAGRALCMEFDGEVLVDADHASESDGSTEALAWIQDLERRDDGLWALFRWTDTGAEAVSGRRYRFVSPAWRRGLHSRGSPVASDKNAPCFRDARGHFVFRLSQILNYSSQVRLRNAGHPEVVAMDYSGRVTTRRPTIARRLAARRRSASG